VVAEVGDEPADDQIYRITFDGSVTDESGFVVFGGDAAKVSAVLKERYSAGLSLEDAFAAALAALSALTPPGAPAASGGSPAPANGEQRTELTASQLEVAILDRSREHRKFRRIRAARLEELVAAARAADAPPATDESPSAEAGGDAGTSGETTES
jgi:proteasome alpha subunit